MYQFSHSQKTRILIMHQWCQGPLWSMAAVTLAIMLAAQAPVVMAQEEHNSEIPG